MVKLTGTEKKEAPDKPQHFSLLRCLLVSVLLILFTRDPPPSSFHFPFLPSTLFLILSQPKAQSWPPKKDKTQGRQSPFCILF